MWLSELEELKKMLTTVNQPKAKPTENTTVNKIMKIKKVVKKVVAK